MCVKGAPGGPWVVEEGVPAAHAETRPWVWHEVVMGDTAVMPKITVDNTAAQDGWSDGKRK